MEKQMLQLLRDKLIHLGYPEWSLRIDVATQYGQRIDLVAYEFEKPHVVFEFKKGMALLSNVSNEELGFHPVVRQAQALAHSINAPYFAVFDGEVISWFEVDKEQGRPRLLQKPILLSMGEQAEARLENGRNQALRLLFALSDLARGYFHTDVLLTLTGSVMLARLQSETGDSKPENYLQGYSQFSQSIDGIFFDQDIAHNERFYREAFSLLNSFTLSRIPPVDFIEAIDEFLQNGISRSNYGILKLPIWISSLMVHLAQITSDDNLLDVYSHFGDVVASVGQINNRTRVFSITPDPLSYLWEQLKRKLLGFEQEDVTRIANIQGYEEYTHKFFEYPNKVLVAPPFNVPVDSRNSIFRNSEGYFMQLSLEWVESGGIIVALVPEGLLFASAQEPVRDYISHQARVRAIISLEQFMPGTKIKASIIVLEKNSADSQGESVMMHKIPDNTIRALSNATKSFSGNENIQKLLAVYQAHIQNEPVQDGKGTWFIPLKNLDTKTWSINYYDPTRSIELSSPYPTKSLQDLAKLRKGSPLTLEKNGSIPVIGPGSLRAFSIDPTKLDRTTEERLPTHPIVASTNDVLIHALGAHRGEAAVVEPDFQNHFVSRNIIIVYSISPQILPAYLAVALNSSFVKKQFKERSTGSVITQLSINRLGDVLVPIPDLPTQELIIERVSNSRQKLVEKEHQLLMIEYELKEQQNNLQRILDNIHLGGGEDA